MLKETNLLQSKFEATKQKSIDSVNESKCRECGKKINDFDPADLETLTIGNNGFFKWKDEWSSKECVPAYSLVHGIVSLLCIECWQRVD